MTRLIALVRLDAQLALRHNLVTVTLAVALAFGLIVGFLVPTELVPTELVAAETALTELGASVELPAPTVLDPEATKLRLDHQLLLLLFALDLCLLGLMFGAVMVLEDRRTGTIALHRVTPIGALHYVASKLSVNLGLTTLNYAILVGLIAPALLGSISLFGLVLTLCAGMTLVGIGLAPLARSIAHFFFPLLVIGLVTSLPMFQIGSPAPGLDWTRALPTWQVLFGGEAIAFGEGRAAALALAREAWIYAGVFVLASAGFALASVHVRAFRETH